MGGICYPGKPWTVKASFLQPNRAAKSQRERGTEEIAAKRNRVTDTSSPAISSVPFCLDGRACQTRSRCLKIVKPTDPATCGLCLRGCGGFCCTRSNAWANNNWREVARKRQGFLSRDNATIVRPLILRFKKPVCSPYSAGAYRGQRRLVWRFENRFQLGRVGVDTKTMMDPVVKTALALCVLLSGVCAALLFRRDPPAVASPPPPPQRRW